jgi:large subunit ribosomal protein L6
MSRLGKLPIEIPAGTQIKIEDGFVAVKGPKGELREKANPRVKLEIGEKEARVSVANPEEKTDRSLWGMFRGLVNNMVIGVNKGFEKKLEISGVGYRAAVAGTKLTVNAGYSHPVIFELPAGITAKVEGNIITINGIDKYAVGETAARIRKIRKPEPYKGKGIKYSDEIIRRKAGKTAAK